MSSIHISSSIHIRKECKHGTVVSQCRCPSQNKSVQIVDCPAQCTKPRRVYVASSWRNSMQGMVVATLRAAGLEVYDFKHPETAFHWNDVEPSYPVINPGSPEPGVDAHTYLKMLEHPLAERGFANDFDAMKWADIFVLVLPCGRSAHLELGWAVGSGRESYILLDGERVVPELMYKMATAVAPTMLDLLGLLGAED